MSYAYEQKKNRKNVKNSSEPFVGSGLESAFPNSALLEEPGHQVDMPVVMREKMEGAFGMDLSGVKLYENKAVGKAGAEAVAQGSRIAFAPGRLDFSSTHGQALLGHEISHVASQARGEVKGSGLVNDSALEARADREGLMAARGESISMGYGGASAALSSASAAPASGPMQAKSGKRREQPQPILNDNIEMLHYPAAQPRSIGELIMDWFRTTGSHWTRKDRTIMDRADADTKAMFSLKEEDNDIMPVAAENIADEIKKEEDDDAASVYD